MIKPVSNLEIALVGVRNLNPDFLPLVVKNTIDVWFLSDAIDPAAMLRRVLVDINTSSLHLLGLFDNGSFRFDTGIIKAEHFPCFEQDQMYRTITLWGCNDSPEKIPDDSLPHAILKQTRMSVFVSRISSKINTHERVDAEN